MAESRTCERCGSQLPSDAPLGVCPFCVLQLGSDGAGGGGQATSAHRAGPSMPTLEELAALFPQLELIGLIGRGGMGVVYKARQPNLDRLVALKILPPEVGRDPNFAERFSREARALARLSHPNIVAIYDSGRAGELYYFLMEYVDGVNLRQAILAEQVDPAKALAIVPQICDALQYAHEEGVVHRDIKPENILLDRKGRVKVADFGLAKLLGLATQDITLTGTFQTMGTLHYMAPEQYEQPQQVDHRADIYSLGVVFYELLTGKLPLGRFALPSENLQIDVRLDEVVLKTLEREPQRRYQYISEVKTDVESIQREKFASAPAVPAQFHRPRTGSVAGSTPNGFSRAMIWLGITALASTMLCCPLGLLVSGGFGLAWAEMLILLLLGFVLVVGGATLVILGLLYRHPVDERHPVDGPRANLPPEKAAGFSARARDQTESLVRWPATALLCIASLNAVMLAVPLLFMIHDGSQPVVLLLLFGFWTAVVSLGIALGAVKMRQLQNYSMATTASILALLPQPAWLLSLPVGIWSLIVLGRPDTRQAFEVPPAQSKSPAMRRGLVLLAIAPLALIGILLAIWTGRSIRTAPAPQAATHAADATTTYSTTESMGMAGPDPTYLQAITWTDAGPKLGPKISQLSKFDQQQLTAIDEALAAAYQKYLAAERKHITRSVNAAGHQVVKVAVFPKELSEIENEFWTEVDRVVFDDVSRGVLREHLEGRIFSHGNYEVTYEMWRVGAWYYYQMGNNSQSNKGPQLPYNLAHLWEPATEPGPAEAEPE